MAGKPGRPRTPTPEEVAAEQTIVDAFDDSPRDPLWKRRIKARPIPEVLADQPRTRTLSLQVNNHLYVTVSRAAREDNISRSAWMRRLLADECLRRYGGTSNDYTHPGGW